MYEKYFEKRSVEDLLLSLLLPGKMLPFFPKKVENVTVTIGQVEIE